MSIPVNCPRCGKLVGVFDTKAFHEAGLMSYSLTEKVVRNLEDSIVGCDHSEPQRTETRKLFGLIKQIHVLYPETETSSSWEEYAGPSSKFLLWFAIFFGTDGGILVNGKWIWWDFKMGFFGEGFLELEKLKAKAE